MSLSSPRKLIAVQNVKSIVGLWIFSLLWCGISFAVLWAFAIQSKQAGGAIVGGLFSLIGLVLLYASLNMTLEYIKYGRVFLTLEGEPPAAGGSFSATIQLPADAMAAGKVGAELACVQVSWLRGSKGDRSKSESDAWTRKLEFPVRRGVSGGNATLLFDIPADQPASNLPGESAPDALIEFGAPAGIDFERSYYRWELRVNADVPGIDFNRTYRLQVGPAKQGAVARPAVAPVMAPRPTLRASVERKIEARQEAGHKLKWVCALIGIVPIIVPLAILGLAVGLAGCPFEWSSANPPSCVLAGIDWGLLRSRAFDLMSYTVPAGIAGSSVLFFAGQLWLDRVHKTDGMGGQAGLAIGVVVLGFFLYHVWQFTRPTRSDQPAASQAQQVPAAGEGASNVERGSRAR